jgi:F-type H+-transporting ATPase subunit b
LQTERQTIVRQLRAEIGSLAVELAGRIVGESLEDEARRRGTVTRFLEELGDGSAPAGAGGRR